MIALVSRNGILSGNIAGRIGSSGILPSRLGARQSFRSFFTSSRTQKPSVYPQPATSSANYDDRFNTFAHCSVAVAFHAKSRTPSNRFRAVSPTPASLSPTGEDNLFVSSRDGYVAVGVADGVGGWIEAGYDSSAISRELCGEIRRLFEISESPNPKQLLSLAFSNILSSPAVQIGGTTACLGVLTPERRLLVSNLGDSWCGVFRDFSVVHQTAFQTHNFNTPYQLAKIPKNILDQAAREGRRYIMDTPDAADEYAWDLQKDDIVVFATDGVTDNVVPQDIGNFLRDHQTEKLVSVSERLVREVVRVSKDENFPSAFAQELSRLTGQTYLGGKEDDVTVVIMKIS